ncbi:hypothetical protein GWK47_044986 [Chionoecetes opilio]|uniref:Uncharacterized protein n=1 Tax=Chionoecetes opilio TaxID=41210 RepID=A0A8J4Y6R6_CHIOP|nr:hypothetical protein GWK47_044986 [Chionoecetes opilio]
MVVRRSRHHDLRSRRRPVTPINQIKILQQPRAVASKTQIDYTGNVRAAAATDPSYTRYGTASTRRAGQCHGQRIVVPPAHRRRHPCSAARQSPEVSAATKRRGSRLSSGQVAICRNTSTSKPASHAPRSYSPVSNRNHTVRRPPSSLSVRLRRLFLGSTGSRSWLSRDRHFRVACGRPLRADYTATPSPTALCRYFGEVVSTAPSQGVTAGPQFTAMTSGTFMSAGVSTTRYLRRHYPKSTWPRRGGLSSQ